MFHNIAFRIVFCVAIFRKLTLGQSAKSREHKFEQDAV